MKVDSATVGAVSLGLALIPGYATVSLPQNAYFLLMVTDNLWGLKSDYRPLPEEPLWVVIMSRGDHIIGGLDMQMSINDNHVTI